MNPARLPEVNTNDYIRSWLSRSVSVGRANNESADRTGTRADAQQTRRVVSPAQLEQPLFQDKPLRQLSAEPAVRIIPRNRKPHDHPSPDDNGDSILQPGDNKDPSLKYVRRPRYKTREDRYEYKAHDHAKKVVKMTGRNKRSARRKSGATLNDEFQAPNVESERLTLKQTSRPGFLNKGRASAPVAFRGLPDLTFSEMSFLKHRRILGDAGIKVQQAVTIYKKRNSKNQDISGYFAQPTCHASDRSSPSDGLRHVAEQSDLSEPHAVPSRPMLRCQQPVSDISLSRKHARPVMAEFEAADGVRTWLPRSYKHPSHQHGVPDSTGEFDVSDGRAASRISWSSTVEHEPDRKGHAEVRRRVGNSEFPLRRQYDPIPEAGPVHPWSSVSNTGRSTHARLLLERYGDEIVRPRADPYSTVPQYYDLDDLKEMASWLPDDMAHEGIWPGCQVESHGERANTVSSYGRRQGCQRTPKSRDNAPGRKAVHSRTGVGTFFPTGGCVGDHLGLLPEDIMCQGEQGSYDIRTDVGVQQDGLDEFDLRLIQSSKADICQSEQQYRPSLDTQPAALGVSATSYQYRRPQLLCPSEDELCEVEAFAGFSRPWILF